MSNDPDRPLGDQVLAFLNEVSDMKAAIADVDVPGWIIGKPTIAELNSDLAIMTARSKPGENQPFVLPDDAEASIAVLEGAIRIDAGNHSMSMIGRHFSVLAAGPHRTVVALEPRTRIYCTFFRARVNGDGSPVASK